MSGKPEALLRAWKERLETRLKELPGELRSLEDAGKAATAELVRQAPDLVQGIKEMNKFVFSLARRKAELETSSEVLAGLDAALAALGETGGGAVAEVPVTHEDVLVAQEEERRRTSIRIHDGPAQVMANVIMRLEYCERLARKDATKAAKELVDVRRELEGVLAEVRRLIFDLRPMTLDDLGLIPTLQQLVEQERKLQPFDLQLLVRGPFERFGKAAETHFYRIVQEGLWNAARHARPTHVQIRLQIEPEAVTLVVEDDGAGLDPSAEAPGTGMGEIRRRVAALGGRVAWEPRMGGGCRLQVEVPRAQLGTP